MGDRSFDVQKTCNRPKLLPTFKKPLLENFGRQRGRLLRGQDLMEFIALGERNPTVCLKKRDGRREGLTQICDRCDKISEGTKSNLSDSSLSLRASASHSAAVSSCSKCSVIRDLLGWEATNTRSSATFQGGPKGSMGRQEAGFDAEQTEVQVESTLSPYVNEPDDRVRVRGDHAT